MADAWGGAWNSGINNAWWYTWGDDGSSAVATPAPAVGGKSRGRPKSQKRWILPNDMHFFGTAEEAQELAEQLTEKPVAVRQERPKRPVVLKTSDGVDAIAEVVYPVERLGQSSASSEVARTQVAGVPEINYQAIENLINVQRRRRKKAMLLLMG